VEDDVNVWCYAIVSCMPETMMMQYMISMCQSAALEVLRSCAILQNRPAIAAYTVSQKNMPLYVVLGIA